MEIQAVAVAMAICGVAATGLQVWLCLLGIRAIRELVRGGLPRVALAASPIQHPPLVPIPPASALSEREVEVLMLVAQGYDNARIAADLFIAEGTVKNHITNIYGKLGVRTRAEAVAWAWRHGVMASSIADEALRGDQA